MSYPPRKSSGAAGQEQERLVNDRAQYIAFLEQQLERVSAACTNVQFMDEKLDHLKQTQNTYEAKISNLAKLVKLDKQHTSQIKADTLEYADTLKQRLQFVENQTRTHFERIEEHLARMDTMYAAFPQDAAAINLLGGAQPQGLPGFIASYIHSLFTQHTQSTAASLTQQSQTHQIHLQNWVQEYIKSSHPSSKLAEDVASFKAELAALSSKVTEGESRMVGLIEKRMAGYTEIYGSMEERFLQVVSVHQKRVQDVLAAYEARMEEMSRQVDQTHHRATRTADEVASLATDLASTKASHDSFLSSLEEMKSKLDAGISEFNANINELVLELREKTWHAEQTCSRLAVDTISRQNVFSKKVETQLLAQGELLRREVQEHVSKFAEGNEALAASLSAMEKRMEKVTRKNENRMQILANTMRDKFDNEEAAANKPASSSAATSVHFTALDRLSEQLDSKLDAFRSEVASNQAMLRADLQELVARSCREVRDRIERQVEDKMHLAGREGTTATGGGAAPTKGAAEGEVQGLRSELNAELKRNMAAMHALLEDKLKSVDRPASSAPLSSDANRSSGPTLRELEDKSRAADEFLRKAQDLYQSMQRQAQEQGVRVDGQQQNGAVRHRPASPTIHPPSNSMPRPPRSPRSSSPPVSSTATDSAPSTQYPHPPAFATTLPYYHDPRDPQQTFLAHSSLPQGAYVPPPRSSSHVPQEVHRHVAPDTREEVVKQTSVRKAADAALQLHAEIGDGSVSPIYPRSSSPPAHGFSPSHSRAGHTTAAIHHRTAADDLSLPRPAAGSKPYALIPTHFPPAAPAPSYFDMRGGPDGQGGSRLAREGPGSSSVRPLASTGAGGAPRSLDDSDIGNGHEQGHERAPATGMGNIDQLLRSMEYMDSVEGRRKQKPQFTAATEATTSKQRSRGRSAGMKRTGGGFVAPNLLMPTAFSASKAKSAHVDEEDEDGFLRHSTSSRRGQGSAASSSAARVHAQPHPLRI